jgi:hypothetical protein
MFDVWSVAAPLSQQSFLAASLGLTPRLYAVVRSAHFQRIFPKRGTFFVQLVEFRPAVRLYGEGTAIGPPKD